MAPVPKRDEVAEAFRKLDLDGDGFLSAAELKAVLCRPTPAGIKFTEAKVDELVRRFDTNGDGLLSLEEVIAGWNELGLSPAANAKDVQRVEFKDTDGDDIVFLLNGDGVQSVSYTHPTLPTILLV